MGTIADNAASIEIAQKAVDSARELKQRVDELQPQARAALRELQEYLVHRQLEEVTVAQLKKASRGESIRWGLIETSGYANASQIAKASDWELGRIHWVGEAMAGKARSVALLVKSERMKAIQVKFDPDHRVGEASRLLRRLRAIEVAGQVLSDDSRKRFAKRVGRLDSLVEKAKPTASRWKRLFYWGNAWKEAGNAMSQLDSVLASHPFRSFQHELQQARKKLDEPGWDDAKLWADFERRAADYYALLEKIYQAPKEEVEAIQGFVPLDIARRAEALELNLEGLAVSPRMYQKFGMKFALVQRRVILGDEMGLGKTVEALGFIAHIKAGGATHILIVTPASVLANWEHEIARHTRFSSTRAHGRDKQAVLDDWSKRGGLLLTTFDTLRTLDFENIAPPTAAVVDEAHYVKNPATKRAKALALQFEKAEYVLFLTGTPMENRVEEFQALVNYLQPEVAQRLDSMTGMAGSKVFRQKVAPVYLRRNQEDVLHELPQKIEVEDWVEFTETDHAYYREATASGHLMPMRRAAFQAGNASDSAKLARLVEIVEAAKECGLKAIAFSFFLDVLETIAAAAPGRVFGPLTGALSPSARHELIQEFTDFPKSALLVSQIQAGGVGLNIQAASVVIIAEPQWKPSTEDQAIARCHRMGQARRVQVHRLLNQNSVDEKIRSVLLQKAEQFDEYARKSAVKYASPEAMAAMMEEELTEAGESGAAKAIVRQEQERLGLPITI